MGRKPRDDEDEEEAPRRSRRERTLRGETRRMIGAIVAVLGAVLTILSFFGAAARLGVAVDDAASLLFGFGKWLFPILLLGLAAVLFRHRESVRSDFTKMVALLSVFVAALAFIHLFLGDSFDELLRVARRGDGGGYFGFGLAAALLYAVGRLAAGAILIALIMIGLVAAFNLSLSDLLDRVRQRRENGDAEGLGEGGEAPLGIASAPERETTMGEGPSQDSPMSFVDPFTIDPDALLATSSGGAATEVFPDGMNGQAEDANIKNVRFSEETLREGDVLSAEGEEEFREGEVYAKQGGANPASVRSRKRKYQYQFPKKEYLETSTSSSTVVDTARAQEIIRSTLRYFSIEVTPKEVNLGPTVIQYTFEPAPGVHLSRITALSSNLSLALSATAVRIEAPIPGKALIGIEVPRGGEERVTVRLRNFLELPEFRSRRSNLTIVLGEGPGGKPEFADLTSMPHLLIAGRTNSGKSVCINSILLSLLYQNDPNQLKLILIDPKRVELSHYRGLPHLRADVVVDPKKVLSTLRWAVDEMTRRYVVLEGAKVRNIEEYHEARSRGARTVKRDSAGLEREEGLERMPYIVIVIDEMADLMVAHQKEIEPHIVRLAQLSRAVGIHLILATQRPSVEVVTGLIKTNFPTRIAFQVSSQIDSRTVLDTGGAEKLIGKGDLLYSPPEGGGFRRIQGVYVSTSEVERVVEHWREEKRRSGDDNDSENEILDSPLESAQGSSGETEDMEEDLVARATELVIRHNRPSTTFLQRMLSLGYPKADRIMGVLEERGIVSAPQGNRRTLLVSAGAAPLPAPTTTERTLAEAIPAILPPGSENH